MNKDGPKDFLRTLQPLGQISDVKDIVDAIVYLTSQLGVQSRNVMVHHRS